MAKNRYASYTTNKNARVLNYTDRTGKNRTATSRRDGGQLDVAISTDERNNSTRCFIDLDGRSGNVPFPSLELNGRQARTLYLTLKKHFDSQGKYVDSF